MQAHCVTNGRLGVRVHVLNALWHHSYNLLLRTSTFPQDGLLIPSRLSLGTRLPDTQLTTCDCSLISASTASYLSCDPPLPRPWSNLLISLAKACLRARSEPLTPVVRMPTSMTPVFGSVADCFRASRWSLNAHRQIVYIVWKSYLHSLIPLSLFNIHNLHHPREPHLGVRLRETDQ